MLILKNAAIFTLNTRQPQATALAIENGHILAAGTDQQVLGEARPRSQVLDLHGQTIWPGLIDAHLHLDYYSLGLQKVDCETSTREECLRRVAERAGQAGTWILGHGWNHNTWPGGYGTAAQLDAVAAGRPVYLTAKSLHAGWASSLALQAAGISAVTPDPEGGTIQRDDQGRPTGILLESAMELVNRILPAPTPEEMEAALLRAQTSLWKMGVTGVHDFDQRRCFQALQRLHQNGQLCLRVVKGVPFVDLSYAIGAGLRSGFGDDMLRIGPVKLFSDGALGPQTAAMLQPYDGTQSTGVLLLDEEEIVEIGQQASANGLSLAIHAIGDRANHTVLSAYARLREFERENGLPALRHRIEHVQILHPDDVSRFKELGVIASMQPIHATSDMQAADLHWGKRSAHAYAWRTLLDHGTALAFGSDAPVESPNPFWGMYAAATRRRADGTPGPAGWYPQQRILLQEAVQAYTTGAAYAAGMEGQLGRLGPGYLADLIVLKQDPFKSPIEDLLTIHPTATMVAGEWVWQEGVE